MKKAQTADFPAFEAEMLKVWEKEKTFEKSLEQRQGAKRYSFYDGPPFANGLPHFGHSLVTSIKDALGRYHTMTGSYVERRNGWDCHGLPVEFAIEKELGISGKKQIMELGLQKFNDACRASVFKYKEEWEEFYRRIGRWTDTEHAYATIDRDFTESVWWMLGQVEAKKLLYRGYKSMPYCPRCETPLSNFEVNEGYRDNVPDPSLFVKFKVTDPEPREADVDGVYLLAWTTTPWSLPGNEALAVRPDEKYVFVKRNNEAGASEVLILAKKRLEEVFKDEDTFEVVDEVSGKSLSGLRYEPLYEVAGRPKSDNMFKVWASEVVSIEDGTGVLHVAPAFGEDDLNLALDNDIPVMNTVKRDGHLVDEVPLASVRNVFFKDADRAIIEDLTEKGRVYAAETFLHTYPFCYRCDSPLLYYAITTWFVKVSAVRDELLKTAEQTNWQPDHIKAGRFGKWLEGARDWAISRNRYWGAPLPIWVNEKDEDDYLVVTSLDELVKLAGLEGKPEDLHRPGIDDIIIEKDGKKYVRVEEVFDCWFESGSMPVAQQHYPFEREDVFTESFPADYVGEGLDQTRLWFYVLHVLSTIAFDRPAYKNVLVNGIVMAADGQKLSKRLRNYPPVEEVFATEGADVLRFYLLGNDQAVSADYMRFNRDAMRDIQRNVFGTVWNAHTFLTMYAEIDGWHPGAALEAPKSDNLLDQWILARLNETTLAMTEAADDYKLARAIRPLRELVDDLSNWYVRRSRRRFWKSEDDRDKHNAYVTLHFVLSRIAQLMAPWAPFVSDKLWRDLTEETDEVKSVHLSDWPKAGPVDSDLIVEMRMTRDLITSGLQARAAVGIKVRQPLAAARVVSAQPVRQDLLDLMSEELNVKRVELVVESDIKTDEQRVELDTDLTPELKAEGTMREIVRHVQNARRASGLEVDDRIVLTLETKSKGIAAAVQSHGATIKAETLATELKTQGASDQVPVRVDGEELYIGIEKASH